MPIAELIRKAYAFWRRYGSVALLHRIRGEYGLRKRRIHVPVLGAPPPPIKTVSDLGRERFHSLQPLSAYLLPTSAQRRVNVVTDSIGSSSLFGGVGTALIFATLLANALDAPLRIITRTEPPHPDNVNRLFTVYGLTVKREIQFAYAPAHDPRQCVGYADSEWFITTSWWTTHASLASVAPQQLIYLLQEDERMFYPYGDDRLRCEAVFQRRDIRFLINTQLLWTHLVSTGLPHMQTQASWFEPAFPANVFYPRAARPTGSKRQFLFYARPNNLRNLFYLGLEVIDAAIAQNILDPQQWDIIFVGKDIPDFVFCNGSAPIKRQNLNWADYAELAGGIDLALSLMYTPHPSYPPLDLAASGAVVVTNQFANKQQLSDYCRNILCAAPDKQALVEALRAGVGLCDQTSLRQDNFAQRQLGTDWQNSLAQSVARFVGTR